MSFKKAKLIALKSGATPDQAEFIAFKYHKPEVDKYIALQKFLEMEKKLILEQKASYAKSEWYKIFKEDPRFEEFDLDELLNWEYSYQPDAPHLGLAEAYRSFPQAMFKNKPDVVKYLLATGYELDNEEMKVAILKSPEIVKVIEAAGGVFTQAHLNNLFSWIEGNPEDIYYPETVEHLINEKGLEAKQSYLTRLNRIENPSENIKEIQKIVDDAILKQKPLEQKH